MTADYVEEFKTVDLLLKSKAETRSVDAFSLTVIKAERQIRKLVTHLIYQFPCFGPSDVLNLRQTLCDNRRVYFEGFEKGFDALYPRRVSDLIGAEYQKLKDGIDEARDHRNKIFHGQLTAKSLSREALEGYASNIRNWCDAIATGADAEFHYDGFGRNSFRKSAIPDLSKRLKVQIGSIADYERFVRQYMQ